MFNSESIRAKGNLTIVVTNEKNEIVEEKNVDNLIVTTGRNWIAARLTDATAASNTQMSYMSIGEGTVAAAISDTILGSEKQKVVLSSNTVVSNVVTYSATFPTTASNIAVTEAGIFNAVGANTGTMLCRTTFPVVNKLTNDSMSITWTVSIS